MKRVAFIAVIISLIMSACKTPQQAVSVNNDDVYSTPSRQKSTSAPTPNPNQDLTSALAVNEEAVAHDSLKAKAATLDYSDVSYADRIKKFQHPQSNTSYFGNSSADTTVVYSTNPNININLGYGGGYDDYGPSFSFGFGWGYGWGYPYYWDYPWYYYPYPYYGYGYPYWYYGYYPYYPYWEGGYYHSYYGPRESVARNSAYTPNSREASANIAPATRNSAPGVANERLAPSSSVRSTTQSGTPGRSTDPGTIQQKPPASQERYHYTRPANERQGTYNRNTGQGNAYRDTRQQPSPRYTQPGAVPVQRQSQVQNYTPGNYRQARSSQEYINPRVQVQNSAGRPATVSGNRSGSSINHRGYSSPGNSAGSRSQPYSSPRSYSPSRGFTPSHSFSSPSGGGRSGGGYSGGGGGGHSGGGGGGHSGGGGRR